MDHHPVVPAQFHLPGLLPPSVARNVPWWSLSPTARRSPCEKTGCCGRMLVAIRLTVEAASRARALFPNASSPTCRTAPSLLLMSSRGLCIAELLSLDLLMRISGSTLITGGTMRLQDSTRGQSSVNESGTFASSEGIRFVLIQGCSRDQMARDLSQILASPRLLQWHPALSCQSVSGRTPTARCIRRCYPCTWRNSLPGGGKCHEETSAAPSSSSWSCATALTRVESQRTPTRP